MQQPPLTRLLRGLEYELGVLLLRRLPRGVRPTEAGQVLLERRGRSWFGRPSSKTLSAVPPGARRAGA